MREREREKEKERNNEREREREKKRERERGSGGIGQEISRQLFFQSESKTLTTFIPPPTTAAAVESVSIKSNRKNRNLPQTNQKNHLKH